MRRYAWAGGLFLGLMLLAAPVHAVITAKTPLSAILMDKSMPFIVVAKVESFDADKLRMILTVEEHLKGKVPFSRLPVNLKSTEKEGVKEIPVLLKRLAEKIPLVLIVKDLGDGEYTIYGYSNGTWFMLIGKTPDGADAPRWVFSNLEPYLRRTFKGTTAEMRQSVIDTLSGKKAPPAWDENEKPGVGPEVKPEEEEQASGGRQPPGEASDTGGLTPPARSAPSLAVIPSVIIGGPLAILAMLFPTWFGGWKRWLALISGLCTASSVVFVYWLWGHLFATSVWGGDLAQWLLITIVIILHAAWAWQRHLTRVQDGDAPAAPTQVEFIVLAVLCVMAFGALVVCWKMGIKLTSPSWLILAPMGIAAVVGMAFVLLARRVPRQRTAWEELDLWTPAAPSTNGHGPTSYSGSAGGVAVAVAEHRTAAASSVSAPTRAPALATEVVMLTVMAVACTAFAVALEPRGVGAGKAVSELFPVLGGELVWTFRPEGAGQIASSPLIVGDRVYVGATLGTLGPQGVVYCLDRATGKPIWDTRKTLKRMKQISISSPVLVDGKLYLGEGFHQDVNCKVYCLNAETGKEIWSFPTGSHTESSPFVTGGKVYIGAGDDGLYCVDAADGTEVWHYNGLHIDANPVVHNKRLYVGAGEGDVYKETAIVCLDTDTGKEVWKHKLDVPAWGSPVLAGDLVYFGIGNGHFDSGDAKPVGAVLCVNATDGEKVWRFDTADGVLSRPSVDRSRVWFGARDGNLYCVDRHTGKLHWKRALGSPVVTAAVVARGTPGELANAVYALGSEGQIFCLEPNTGAVCWQKDLTDGGRLAATRWSSPALALVGRDKQSEKRQLIFGATLGSLDAPSPAVFCFEDRLSGSGDEVIVESR